MKPLRSKIRKTRQELVRVARHSPPIPATLARGIGLVVSESTMPFFEKATQYGLDQAAAPYGAKLL